MNINDLGRAADAEAALPATPTEPVPVSSLSGDDQPRGWEDHPAVMALLARADRLKHDEDVEVFVRESNRIESIETTTARHYSAHWQFLRGPVTIPALIELVGHLQPDARFRNSPNVPGVRVGNHIAPPSGPDIETHLRHILAMRDPWEQHVAYETLHPFTDGNGRSGRAIWLHRHFHEPGLDRWAVQRGFLHSWYYHTLSSVRRSDIKES